MTPKEYHYFLGILNEFLKNRKTLFDFCKNETDVVLCHNDLNISNLLINLQDKLLLLDYEYANYNSIFYDFGNFFGETNFKLVEKDPFFVYDPENINKFKIKEKVVDYLSNR